MTALQLWHCTLRRSVLPAALGRRQVAQRRAPDRFSATLPSRGRSTYGDSVPQNGHTSFCFDGFHSACAPQAGQACFSSAETSVSRL